MEEKGLKCIGGNARGIKIVMGRKMGNAMEKGKGKKEMERNIQKDRQKRKKDSPKLR